MWKEFLWISTLIGPLATSNDDRHCISDLWKQSMKQWNVERKFGASGKVLE